MVSSRRLISACSAFCDSFMNTANVVCMDQRLTMPSRTAPLRTTPTTRSVTSISSTRSSVCIVSVSPRTMRPPLPADEIDGEAPRAFTLELLLMKVILDLPLAQHLILPATSLTDNRSRTACYTRATTDVEPVNRNTGSARRSREVGGNPTRCRHCKREAAFLEPGSTGSHCATTHGKARDAALSSENPGNEIREPGYLTPGRPFPPLSRGIGARTRREGVPCEFTCSCSLRSLQLPSLPCLALPRR